MSQSDIAKVTGIPRSTVGYVIRGERDLPTVYTTDARNAYRKTAYNDMRNLGMPSHQARRFSSSAVDTALKTIGEFESVVEKYSRGTAVSLLLDEGRAVNERNIRSVLNEAEGLVREGLSKTKQPHETYTSEAY